MESLTDEILTIVFSYLPLVDRLRTKLVCQRFRRVNNSKCLVRDDVIVIPDYYQLAECEIAEGIFRKMRISAVGNIYDENHLKFWKTHGANFESITFTYARERELRVLADLLRMCPKVKNLTLNYEECEDYYGGYNEVRWSDSLNLSRLRSLELAGFFGTFELKRILKTPCKLERFRMVDCFSSGRDAQRAKILYKFMRKQALTIRELEIVDHGLDLSKFDPCTNENMTSLILTVPNATPELNNYIANNFVNLETLHILYDAPYFSMMMKKLSKLTDLRLIGFNTDFKIDNLQLGVCPNIQKLKLQQTTRTQLDFYARQGELPPTLTHLEINEFIFLDENELRIIVGNLPCLQHLIVSFVDNVTEKLFKDIAEKNKWLETLSVVTANRINVEKFLPYINLLSKLTKLRICRKAEDDYSYCLGFLLGLNLPLLKMLLLSRLEMIHSWVFKQTFRSCPLLEFIVDVLTDESDGDRVKVRTVLRDLTVKQLYWWDDNEWHLTKC